MTIKTKLTLSFALLILLSMILYGASWFSMNGLNNRINNIGESTAVQIRLGSRINEDLLFISRAEKSMILAREEADITTLAQEAIQRAALLKDRLSRFSALADAGTKAELDKFSQKFDLVMKNFEQIRLLALQNSKVKAEKILTEGAKDAYGLAEEHLLQVIELASGSAAFVGSNLLSEVNRLSITQHEMLITEDQAQLELLYKKNKEISQGIDLIKTRLSNLLTANNRSHFDKAENNINVLLNHNREITELSLANTNAKAFEISEGEGRVINSEARAVLAGLVNESNAQLETDMSESDANFASANTLMLSLIIIGLVVAIIIAYRIINSITSGLSNANQAIKTMGEGDFTAEIDIESKDEIGTMLKSMVRMRNKLSEIVGTVKRASDNISSASQQVSAGSQQLAEGAQEQSSSTEQASSSMEQMSANIDQSKDNAQQTEKISRKASADIQEASDSVMATVEAINLITQRISVIGDIASKTDLLALNAAVEAARAGEHGKGFAVVASEVRKLAERSQEAAAEIDKISASTVQKAERSGELLKLVVPDIERTSELVQEISASLVEQSGGSDQINTAIQQLTTVTQQNASSSEEMASSAEELAAQAEELNDTMSYFRLNANDAIKKIKNKESQPVKKTAPNGKNGAKKQNDFDIILEQPGKTSFGESDFESYK